MHKRLKRFVATILAAIFISIPLMSFAHGTFFLSVLVNTDKMTFEGNIIQDNAGKFSDESRHEEAKLGDFRFMIKDQNPIVPVPNADKDKNPYKDSALTTEDYMVFDFTPIEKGGWFSSLDKDNAGQEDADRAYIIKDTLISSLNDVLSLLNLNQKYSDLNDMLQVANQLSAKMQDVSNGQTSTLTRTIDGTNYVFTFSPGRSNANKDKSPDIKNGILNDDYVTVTLDGQQYEFPYRMLKGYNTPGQDGWVSPVYRNNMYKFDGDAKYITWNMLMYQGVYSLSVRGMTAKDASNFSHPGALESAVVDLFASLFNGVRNLLGLYKMDELIYNEGIRGSRAFVYGIMPEQWMQNVQLYHMIFQAIAWSLITFAIAKLLIQRNLSTINPSMRVSLISGIQDLMITGVVLAFIFPLLESVLVLNMKLVNVFGAVAPDVDDMSGLNNYSNVLAGVILQFFYLVIDIWLNFQYIIRAITVSILMTLAPLFIVTLAFGGHWKQLFMKWMKEILANIFLQSFHAFLFGFLILSQTSSRGIEGIVLCMALIPLTEFFRSMIMGQSGGMASHLGMSTLMAGAGMVAGVAKGATKSVGQKRIEGGSQTNGGGSGGSTTMNPGSNVLKNDIGAGSSDRLRNNNNSPASRTANQDALAVRQNKQLPANVSSASASGDRSAEEAFLGGKSMTQGEAKMKDLKENLKNDYLSKDALKSVGSGATKVALGTLGVVAGAGFAMAMGTSDKRAAGMGTDLAVGSAKRAGGAIRGGTDKMRRTMSEGVDAFGTTYAESSSSPSKPQSQDATTLGSDTVLWERQMPNGDAQIYRDGNALSEQGILRAYEDEDKNAVYHYNLGQMSTANAHNIEHYAKVFASNNKDEIEHLQNSGVQFAGRNGAGGYVVGYNQIGKEKLNIKKVDTIGTNIVETKRANQSAETKVTFAVGSAPVKPKNNNAQNNSHKGGGNKNPNNP